jgi:hypothetical protein
MSGVKVNNGVINYGGLPSGGSGLFAQRPAAGVVGRIFIASDTLLLYRDTGSSWATIGGGGGITGSGSAGQATFWTGASAISGDNAFFWDNTNKRLGINTATPGVRLDIHGTGVIAQFNGTTTNNAYLDFQNAGTTQWRIGNAYNGALQSFSIINAGLTNPVFFILQNGNVSIGGTNPTNKFDVIGNVRIGDTGSSASALITFSNNINGFSYGFNGTTNQRFVWNNGSVTEIMSLLGTGFLGIGYTVPSTMLSVSGNVLIGTNTANALYELFVNGNTYTGGLSPTNSTVAVNTAMTRTQTGYVCTATLTLTLPTVSGLNNIFYVIANTGATVTVQRAGTDTILDKLGVSQTSVIVAAGTRSMFYCGGGSITYQIF